MDMISILVVTVFAIYVRYDFSFKDLPDYFLKSTIWFIPINLVVTMISFLAWNLYTSVWRYASATELIKIIAAVTTATQIISFDLPGCAFGCYIRHQVFLSCASNSPRQEKSPRKRQRTHSLHGYRRRQCGK